MTSDGGVLLDIDTPTSDHGAMEPRYRDKASGHRDDAAVEAVVLDVDGEVFELRPDKYGGTSYSWLTGLNAGGWSSDDHRTRIRWFLTQIDPATGYIGDN